MIEHFDHFMPICTYVCVYIYTYTPHTHTHIYSFNPNTKMKSDKYSLKKKPSCSQCKGAMPYFHLGKGNQAVLEVLDSLRPLTDYLQGRRIWCLADSWGEQTQHAQLNSPPPLLSSGERGHLSVVLGKPPSQVLTL